MATSALVEAALRPRELAALLRYRRKAAAARAAAADAGARPPHWAYAYAALGAVSRSFAVVIMELAPRLRDAVAVFYLVLRALDTVEDDTRIDAGERGRVCREFARFLEGGDGYDGGGDWSSDRYGEGEEKVLLQRFPDVLACFRDLEPAFQRVIVDITRRMGAGMADHIADVECITVADYDLYCHYVAGLVGHGLSDMFAADGAEDPAIADRTDLSNSMGLFLQKTNIIRDYKEDAEEDRTFWPREIWATYADKLTDLADPHARKHALPALNHMVTDALRHVPACIEYMSHVRDARVFNFVAIPQVMAIATLAECFNNGAVLERKVKIRRSLTCSLIMRTTNMTALHQIFFDYAVDMLRRVNPTDPSAPVTRARLNTIIDVCAPHVPPAPDLVIPNVFSIVAFCGLSSYVLRRRAEHYDGVVFTWRSAGGIMEPEDMLAVGLLFLVCMYLFSFFMLPYLSRAQAEELRRMERVRREQERALREFGRAADHAAVSASAGVHHLEG